MQKLSIFLLAFTLGFSCSAVKLTAAQWRPYVASANPGMAPSLIDQWAREISLAPEGSSSKAQYESHLASFVVQGLMSHAEAVASLGRFKEGQDDGIVDQSVHAYQIPGGPPVWGLPTPGGRWQCGYWVLGTTAKELYGKMMHALISGHDHELREILRVAAQSSHEGKRGKSSTVEEYLHVALGGDAKNHEGEMVDFMPGSHETGTLNNPLPSMLKAAVRVLQLNVEIYQEDKHGHLVLRARYQEGGKKPFRYVLHKHAHYTLLIPGAIPPGLGGPGPDPAPLPGAPAAEHPAPVMPVPTVPIATPPSAAAAAADPPKPRAASPKLPLPIPRALASGHAKVAHAVAAGRTSPSHWESFYPGKDRSLRRDSHGIEVHYPNGSSHTVKELKLTNPHTKAVVKLTMAMTEEQFLQALNAASFFD